MSPVRSMTLALVSVSRFFCWIGLIAASTISSSASAWRTASAIRSTWPRPNRVAGFAWRTRKCSFSSTETPIASASPAASSRRAAGSRRAPWPKSGKATMARAPRAKSASSSRLKTLSRSLLGLDLGEIDRIFRLHRRDGVLVDELAEAVAGEQHAEQVERSDFALEHDAIDEEHRHRLVRLADRGQEHLLEQGRLLALDLLVERFVQIAEIDRLRRHDRRDGVLVDELGLAVAARQHREIVEPGDDPLELDALHQEHGDRRLGASQAVQEHVLEIVDLVGHCALFLVILAADRAVAISWAGESRHGCDSAYSPPSRACRRGPGP